VKISRDGFGDRFVGDYGRVFVFAGIHQQLQFFRGVREKTK
jgi:hypothetical protein